ncbi:MAG TPA: peptidoglycan-associated lipoprotein Pal [Burkholderiales bacterium]|jgi:peptidoglycan-associated lipoprotein|nr:peptidoglycan-associated lipoprotein Pal [Burkholderiales bacterium]
MRAFIYPVVAASALLFGCATDEANKPAATAPAAAAAPAPKPSAAESKPVTTVQAAPKTGATGFAALKDPNNILSKRAVYFDYDKFDVKDEFKPLIEAHAKFLRDNSSAKMLIQGNADERGSREYNVGLGQRRSDAVKKMLTLLGARESQIESVSLGEEKPSCSDHTESCWAKNRRDDMLYGGEY